MYVGEYIVNVCKHIVHVWLYKLCIWLYSVCICQNIEYSVFIFLFRLDPWSEVFSQSHVTSYCVILYCIISHFKIISYYIIYISYHIISCISFIISYYIKPYHIFNHIILYNIISYYVLLHHFKYHVILHHHRHITNRTLLCHIIS